MGTLSFDLSFSYRNLPGQYTSNMKIHMHDAIHFAALFVIAKY